MKQATDIPEETQYSFERLVVKERAYIDGRPEPSPQGDSSTGPSHGFVVSRPGPAAEPWVCFSARDSFGLALSGGGIRSATFNLGLLQALDQKGLLAKFHYLSTVSGGGYVGGFLTAWRHRHPEAKSPFLVQDAPASASAERPVDTREVPPIRHLREYSRFLMPRLGLFHMDAWSGVVTILGGMLPSLVAAMSVLLLFAYMWFAIALGLIDQSANIGGHCLGALMLVILLACERSRVRFSRSSNGIGLEYFLYAILASLSVDLLWRIVGNSLLWPAYSKLLSPWLLKNFDVWAPLLPHAIDRNLHVPASVFDPSAALLVVALSFLVLRALTARASPSNPNWSASLDRVIAVFIGIALGWALIAVVWALCRNYKISADGYKSPAEFSGGAAVIAGGLFAWLRNWLSSPVKETRGGTILKLAINVIRPVIPQILAILAVLAMLAMACLVAQFTLSDGLLLPGLFTTVAILALTAWLFNPARVGMHDFYRSRICRCFLGASRADAEYTGRQTGEQPKDDLSLGELRRKQDQRRTLHLVCCTANNLDGDILGNLYRGGRSAVLSPYGIALGDNAALLDDERLSSAMTASAAAFNSQMGRLSINLGPSVAFLMCAMNLRLGLWVPHPLNPSRDGRVLTGLPFFYEMFSWTNCDPELRPAIANDPVTAGPAGNAGRIKRFIGNAKESGARGLRRAEAAFEDANDKVQHYFRDLHLSDGGHFENLALYELVRRHCRYIVVSDCGADPEVAFDDLAIALRTIREDFGVEIDLDVSPLRPDENRRARQHAVVGTIHYDGLDGSDKGTLVYFKPTLTGDEPPDVVQYQTRNAAFPHESTSEQFYDEAQWESYRRLGQHAGAVVFRFIDSYPQELLKNGDRFVDNVFLDAGRYWRPAPNRQNEVFLTLTRRCSELDRDIRENAPPSLRAEFFPEISAAFPSVPPKTQADVGAAPDQDTEAKVVYFLMLASQLMEDTWLGAELDTYWAHPLNAGWMNYFQRWAATPSFRRWWPILQPIYSIGFRDFVRDRFGIPFGGSPGAHGAHGGGARFTEHDNTERLGLVWDNWRARRGTRAVVGKGQATLEIRLELDWVGANLGPRSFPVGFLIYSETADRKAIEWDSKDLYVPGSLNGAGIISRLLDSAVKRWNPDHSLNVIFDQEDARSDPASRLQLVNDINFYKSRAFVYVEPPDSNDKLRLVLPARDQGDA